jgi:LPXTG-site transpeptidase (sortase) family protein
MIRPLRALRRVLRGLLRTVERLLWATAFVCLGVFLAAHADALLFQTFEGWRLEGRLPEPGDPARAAEEEAPPVQPGDVLGKIEIPRLGVDSIVLEGTGAKALRRGVGHIPETDLPGDRPDRATMVGLAGHRDGVFRPLEHVRPDDLILLTTPRGRARYRVVGTEVVQPVDTGVLVPPSGSRREHLTLVTCFPFRFVGAAPWRFIVHARRFDPAPPAP